MTISDVRAYIEQRIRELDPRENGPDTRLMDPNGLADMLAERAVHKELTEVLARLDRVRRTRIEQRVERLERALLGLAKQTNTPEWMHDDPAVMPDTAMLCAMASEIDEIDRERAK